MIFLWIFDDDKLYLGSRASSTSHIDYSRHLQHMWLLLRLEFSSVWNVTAFIIDCCNLFFISRIIFTLISLKTCLDCI